MGDPLRRCRDLSRGSFLLNHALEANPTIIKGIWVRFCICSGIEDECGAGERSGGGTFRADRKVRKWEGSALLRWAVQSGGNRKRKVNCWRGGFEFEGGRRREVLGSDCEEKGCEDQAEQRKCGDCHSDDVGRGDVGLTQVWSKRWNGRGNWVIERKVWEWRVEIQLCNLMDGKEK